MWRKSVETRTFMSWKDYWYCSLYCFFAWHLCCSGDTSCVVIILVSYKWSWLLPLPLFCISLLLPSLMNLIVLATFRHLRKHILRRVGVKRNGSVHSYPTLCDPMNRSTPGLPVYHQLPEFTQTCAHRVGDAIQLSHPLSSPSPAPNSSQHQGLFQWVNSLHQVAKVLKFQLQHQSFQWTPRTDLI